MSRRSPASLPALAIAILAASSFSLYRQYAANQPQIPTPRPSMRGDAPLPQTPDDTATAGTGDATPGASSDGNLLLGNPSTAGKEPDNFLLERSQYSLSYNKKDGRPNWVSWHVDASDMGHSGRGKFRPDPDLPEAWRIEPSDYKNSGYDRGHMCPSGDRTASRDYNNGTFFMSNMVPQTAELNQHIWADLEEYLRLQVKLGGEVYELTGPRGETKKIGEGKVSVPESCWKVAVILPLGTDDLKRIDKDAEVIAVDIPNTENEAYRKEDWRKYLTTAGDLEKKTGLEFFSALPNATRTKLEKFKYSRN